MEPLQAWPDSFVLFKYPDKCMFACIHRTVLKWHLIVTRRLWRRTPSAYVLCTKASSSTDSWTTHRLRFKLFSFSTQ